MDAITSRHHRSLVPRRVSRFLCLGRGDLDPGTHRGARRALRSISVDHIMQYISAALPLLSKGCTGKTTNVNTSSSANIFKPALRTLI
ncbi:hypothetical protein E2C01_022386 [Portunus trituberculatus]|uniref:Uncharacterized protein n=1 Tax=Portunus trituberculatus TaxID=210409 RepID=A0A5B7E7J3_PORTR|nr:hypothetical protein [Portunus trituberculatus]